MRKYIMPFRTYKFLYQRILWQIPEYCVLEFIYDQNPTLAFWTSCTFDTFHYFKHVYSKNICIFPPKPLWVLSYLLHQLFNTSVLPVQFLAVFLLTLALVFTFIQIKCSKLCVRLSEYTSVKGVMWSPLKSKRVLLIISVDLESCLPKSTLLGDWQREFSKYNTKCNLPLLSLFSIVVCFFLNDSAYRILKYYTFHEDQTLKTTIFLKFYFKCHIGF